MERTFLTAFFVDASCIIGAAACQHSCPVCGPRGHLTKAFHMNKNRVPYERPFFSRETLRVSRETAQVSRETVSGHQFGDVLGVLPNNGFHVKPGRFHVKPGRFHVKKKGFHMKPGRCSREARICSYETCVWLASWLCGRPETGT